MKNFTTSIILLLCAFALQAQIINVPGDKSTIQAGIDSASNGDTVLVAEGTYLENLNLKKKGITLASHFLLDGDTAHVSATIIDGSSPSNADTASTIFLPSGAEEPAVICGLMITGGNGTLTTLSGGSRVGGGIYIENSDCIIDNNIIAGNNINYNFTQIVGAAVYNNLGSGNDLTISNNIIENNILTSTDKVRGAGIAISAFNENFSTLIIENNIISGNSATNTPGTKLAEGGGISVFHGLPTNCDFKIRNNLIHENELHGGSNGTYGAGIHVVYFEPGVTYKDDNPTPEIYNNIIKGNTAYPGGGASIGIWTNWWKHALSQGVKPQPVVINNTFEDNLSSGFTSVFNYRSFPILMNNIFCDIQTDTTLEYMGNVIIGSNTNDGIIYALNNVIKGGIEEGDHYVMNNYEFDPYFVSQDSLALSDSSCAIGRGIDSAFVENTWYYAPVLDYNGNARPNEIDGLVDIGAIESPYVRSCDLEPPELTLNSNDTVGIGEPVKATSTEDGLIYLVPVNSTLTLEAIQTNELASVGVIADTPADLPTTDIVQNKYWLVAVDTSGNISKEVEVTLLDLTDIDEATESLRLYPSPVEDILLIESDQAVISVELFNVVGNKVFQDLTYDGSVNLGHLRQGIYFIRIKNETGAVFTGKVIKR